MKKKLFSRMAMAGAVVISIFFSSCAKEELLAPNTETVTDSSAQVLLYIRAVEKDSSKIESERLLLK